MREKGKIFFSLTVYYPPLRGRVMTSDYARTTGNSRVITVASLHRLKMEALIPASADCEVQSKAVSPIIYQS